MTAASLPPVELGYVEPVDEDSQLQSHDLPLGKSCTNPLNFLLQIYAPLSEQAEAFHRTLFLFACRNADCQKADAATNFAAFRCQLPRVNDFFSADPSDEAPPKRVQQWSRLCAVCGCLGDKRCARCEATAYCSRQHQALHWRAVHKQHCGDASEPPFDGAGELFPEYEVVTEIEADSTPKQTERSEEERMRDFDAFVKQQKGGADADVPGEDCFDEMQDKQFKQFRRVADCNPEQVLRYQRGGHPLLATQSAADAPPCELCGSERTFEFQVMPHLLRFLDVDDVGKSLDWATLLVYTCRQNCLIADNGYASEAVIKQDYT